MNWKDKKILIAEDEETNFILLEEYLEITQVQIVRAHDGLQVVELSKVGNYDLILMDIKMPKLTGYEAVKRIREIDKTTPIIAQTAYAMLGDKEKSLMAGCNDYLSKPISENKFLKILAKYLGD
jgi:two-component system, cell cycle response regulator DivK